MTTEAIRGGVPGGGRAGWWGRGDVRRSSSRPSPGAATHPVHVGDDSLLLGTLDVADTGPGLRLVCPGLLGLGVVTTDAAPGARV